MLLDKDWLSKHFSTQKINKISTFLKVPGIKVLKHKSKEFAALLLYFPDKNNARQLVYTSLTCKIHLVKGLRANLLIRNNIMSPENFVLDVKRRSYIKLQNDCCHQCKAEKTVPYKKDCSTSHSLLP